ncbi:MAG: serine hydrolase domain-containing protein, partial [Burkholderiaceae bacterium]
MNIVRWRVRAVPLALLTVLSAGAFAQALPKASPESVGMSSQRLAKITEVIGKEVADKKLPGAVVMVARKGKLVYSQAFGSLNNAAGAPMKEDSIFRLYSMTKPMVSTALMMLVEDGKVGVNEPVGNFIA